MIENDFQLQNTLTKQADLQELLDQKRTEQPPSTRLPVDDSVAATPH